MNEPREMTLRQFCKERGFAVTADVDGHIHAGLRSAPQTKTYQRWNARKLAELQASRDAGVAAYRAEIEAGRIVDPTPRPGSLEALRRAANGHPDNPSTQAAARLLAKRLAMRASAGGGP